MNNRKLITMFILITSLWIACIPVSAQSGEYTRKTLRGIKAMRVVVEEIDAKIEQKGLTRSQIQTDVELRLRMAGIRVIDSNSFSPWLYVNVLVIQSSDMKYSYIWSVNLHFKQFVSLQRDPSISSAASTWNTGYVGSVGSEKMIEAIREYVGRLVDELINDFLAENPK